MKSTWVGRLRQRHLPWLGSRVARIASAIVLVAAVVGAYQFFAPPSLPKVSDLWTSPHPTVSQVAVLGRAAGSSPSNYETDYADVVVRGQAVDPDWKLRNRSLVVFWSLDSDGYSSWRPAVSVVHSSGIASLPTSSLTSDDWELSARVPCTPKYTGLIAVAAIYVPTDSLHSTMPVLHGFPNSWQMPRNWAASNVHFVSSLGHSATSESPYRQVADLRASVGIENFRTILGHEAYSHRRGSGREFAFVHSLYYVQAITDRAGTVLFFAVTTHSRGFRPVFQVPGLLPDGKTINVQLGSSSFSVVSADNIEAGYCWVGADWNLYYETCYLAGAGDFQTVVLANSMAGVPGLEWSGSYDFSVLPPWGLVHNLRAPFMKSFRSHNTVNTYGITAPFVDAKALLKGADNLRSTVGIDPRAAAAD